MEDFQIIGLDVVSNKEKIWDKFYLGDIRDKNLLEEIFLQNKIDIVIHLGAEKALIKCENNKKECYVINYQATMELYRLSKKHKKLFFKKNMEEFKKSSEYQNTSRLR